MAVSLNFRTAIGGFHKEDVVHYIEYVNSKHTAQVSQLSSELKELQDRLADTEAKLAQTEQEREALSAAVSALHECQQQLADMTVQRDQALAQVEEIQVHQAQTAAKELAALELEAYRRAEQAERSAKLRAQQIHQQATGTLAQATVQIEEAAGQFRGIAETVSQQLTQLQQVVDNSKNALSDAAATMYAICPQEP